nr:lysozyme [Cupriavidus gilardii]
MPVRGAASVVPALCVPVFGLATIVEAILVRDGVQALQLADAGDQGEDRVRAGRGDVLGEANAGVNSCVRVPLTDGQRTAFVSFTYNVGRGAFCGSTLVRKLNAGDYVGACNELPRWVYAKGVKLPGLVNRREQERALCLG